MPPRPNSHSTTYPSSRGRARGRAGGAAPPPVETRVGSLAGTAAAPQTGQVGDSSAPSVTWVPGASQRWPRGQVYARPGVGSVVTGDLSGGCGGPAPSINPPARPAKPPHRPAASL